MITKDQLANPHIFFSDIPGVPQERYEESDVVCGVCGNNVLLNKFPPPHGYSFRDQRTMESTQESSYICLQCQTEFTVTTHQSTTFADNSGGIGVSTAYVQHSEHTELIADNEVYYTDLDWHIEEEARRTGVRPTIAYA